MIKKIFDLKYGRTSSPTQVKNAFESDIKDLTTLLLQIFPIAISTGNLGWWDLFRPFSHELQGLAHRKNVRNLPVARIPLTNTFYRQPIVSGKIFHEGAVLKVAKHPFLNGSILQTRFLPAKYKQKGWTLCLPGPFSFSRAVAINSEGQKEYRTRDDLMADFSQILKEEFHYLSSEGFSHIILDEASLTWESVDTDTTSSLTDVWNQIVTKSSLKIAIHTYHHLDEEKLQLLLDSNAWGIGIDCIRNDPRKLADYDFDGKSILAGVVDAQSYLRDSDGELLVEDVDELVKFTNILAEIQTKNVILAPTTRLEFVPRSVADLKLIKIGKALEILLEKEGIV
ncbi:MAG: hypothetical protein ACFFB5_00735 [Promethearchaeota archaeon]